MEPPRPERLAAAHGSAALASPETVLRDRIHVASPRRDALKSTGGSRNT